MRSFCAVLLLVVGCAPAPPIRPAAAPVVKPPNAKIERVRAGQVPKDYVRVIDRHLVATLRDPDSRKLGPMTNPRGGLVCGQANAKNGFGGYTGWVSFRALFDADGRLFDLYFMTRGGLEDQDTESTFAFLNWCAGRPD